jgi:hypothetical protein
MWDHQLTRQLRVLLHADRLLHLQYRDDHRPPEFRHYASLSLALKVFDLVIAHTGLGQDIDEHQVVEELLPLLEAMDLATGMEPKRDRQAQMAERVLSALYNDDNGRRPFELTYTAFEQGRAVERVLPVRLLEERHHTNGRPILCLSNALAFDIEDAQAAAEAIIQS